MGIFNLACGSPHGFRNLQWQLTMSSLLCHQVFKLHISGLAADGLALHRRNRSHTCVVELSQGLIQTYVNSPAISMQLDLALASSAPYAISDPRTRCSPWTDLVLLISPIEQMIFFTNKCINNHLWIIENQLVNQDYKLLLTSKI